MSKPFQLSSQGRQHNSQHKNANDSSLIFPEDETVISAFEGFGLSSYVKKKKQIKSPTPPLQRQLKSPTPPPLQSQLKSPTPPPLQSQQKSPTPPPLQSQQKSPTPPPQTKLESFSPPRQHRSPSPPQQQYEAPSPSPPPKRRMLTPPRSQKPPPAATGYQYNMSQPFSLQDMVPPPGYPMIPTQDLHPSTGYSKIPPQWQSNWQPYHTSIPQPPNPPSIPTEEFDKLKNKCELFEEQSKQLQRTLDQTLELNEHLINTRMTEPERAMYKLKELLEEREKVHNSLHKALKNLGFENIATLDENIMEKSEKEEATAKVSEAVAKTNEALEALEAAREAELEAKIEAKRANNEAQEFKNAVKRLEDRLIQTRAEMSIKAKDNEEERLKLILQSAFTGVEIIKAEELDDRIEYDCLLNANDGVLHFTLNYPKNERNTAEYTPDLTYPQPNSNFISNLDANLKYKMTFQRNALPGLLHFLINTINKEKE